jgi:hypothetical protein
MTDPLTEILAPVRERLAEIDAEIEAKRAEISALLEQRKPYARVLSAADRESGPQKRKPSGGKLKASPELENRVEQWLRENAPAEISTPALTENGFDLCSPSMLNAVLGQLRDHGTLRLDHLGPQGRRIYALTN